jgi:hypothetical protein
MSGPNSGEDSRTVIYFVVGLLIGANLGFATFAFIQMADRGNELRSVRTYRRLSKIGGDN